MSESDDLRTFIREITRRFELGMERISREIRSDVAVQREESRRYFEAIRAEQRAYHEESREKLDEIIAEGRAGREALFRMLDRLDGNGGTAPAG